MTLLVSVRIIGSITIQSVMWLAKDQRLLEDSIF